MRNKGFTLVEILVALFVFSILSLILTGGLHQVISAQQGAEEKAARLREVQIALLLLSRDVEQAVNRPVTNEAGIQEKPFVGSQTSFTLTHMGDVMSRAGYRFQKGELARVSWPALDLPPRARSHERVLLSNVSEVRFYYLDKDKQFQQAWPSKLDNSQPLPEAVKVVLTISDWGKIEQLYPLPFKVYDVKPTDPKKTQ